MQLRLFSGNRRSPTPELETRANRLANFLKEFGVKPETVVGLCVERSPEMVIGLLGILTAGGVCLLLDPSYPSERLRFMLRDAGAAAVVTQSEALAQLSPGPLNASSANLNDLRDRIGLAGPGLNVRLDTDWPDIARRAASAPKVSLDGRNAAYVIYTSGSTGIPKAVVVEHPSLSNKVQTVGSELGFGPACRLALISSSAFDPSIWQATVPLMHGASIVIISDAVRASPLQFWEQVVRQQINVLNCTPAFLDSVLRDAPKDLCLSHLILGGEPFTAKFHREILHHLNVARITNLYGPTETTMDATCHPVLGDYNSSTIPHRPPFISVPRVRVGRRASRPVPPEIPGELYIAGAGLARGYYRRPRLTAGTIRTGSPRSGGDPDVSNR